MDPQDFVFPYTATDLTEQINRIPNSYGLIRAMGLYNEASTISTIVEITIEDGVLRVLPAKDRGAPGTPAERETGKKIFLEIPHFPDLDLITPQDIQNMMVVAANTRRPSTVADELAKRLANIRANHDITLEFIRMGALKGLILDGNGTTLYDLYDVFDIDKVTVDFTLSTDATDIISLCDQVFQSVAKNLKGETMTRVEAVVDSAFFNKFIQHPNVAKYWTSNQQGVAALAQMERQQLGGQWGRVFDFQNILWREYYGQAPTKDAGGNKVSTPFLAAKHGVAYPIGTRNMFNTYFSPADDIRFVNTPGEQIYISPEVLKHGAGIELKSQSNPLAVCNRLEATVEIISSN